MSFKCDNCGKKHMAGNLVSHSKQRMHRRFKPNLHRARAMVNGVVKKLLVCTKCLRRLKRPDKKIEKLEIKKEDIIKKEEKKELPKVEIKEVVVETAKAEPAPKEVKVKQTTVAELMKEPSFAKAPKGKQATKDKKSVKEVKNGKK